MFIWLKISSLSCAASPYSNPQTRHKHSTNKPNQHEMFRLAVTLLALNRYPSTSAAVFWLGQKNQTQNNCSTKEIKNANAALFLPSKQSLIRQYTQNNCRTAPTTNNADAIRTEITALSDPSLSVSAVVIKKKNPAMMIGTYTRPTRLKYSSLFMGSPQNRIRFKRCQLRGLMALDAHQYSSYMIGCH